MHVTEDREWLEADGLGGFASGTASGVRTRRYHALLLTARTPPTGRMVLVNGFDAWVTTPAGRSPISSQRYVPGVVHPDGASRIESFTHDPWPKWVYVVGDDTRVVQELLVAPGEGTDGAQVPLTLISWHLADPGHDVRLEVRPFLSGRDYHSMHHENGAFDFTADARGEGLTLWHPYAGVPPVASATNGQYEPAPLWYRNFLYADEAARGLDATEDLASAGVLTWDLSSGDAHWILAAGDVFRAAAVDTTATAATVRARELARRTAFASPLHRAAEAYVVARGERRTILAGYPWFTDWGRDTFIALPGLCLATVRLY